MNRWFVIRLIIAAVSLSSGLDGTVTAAMPSGIDWRVPGIVFAVMLVGSFCSIGGGYQTEGISTNWTRPSLSQNPFQTRSQPLQFFHMVGVSACAEGIGGMLRELLRRQYEQLPLPGVILAAGLGAWIALRMAVLVFHRKYGAPDSGAEAGCEDKK